MISSASKIRPTTKSNPCPVCGDVKGKCRTIDSEPIALCGNTAKGDEPSGWSYRKPASNPLWNVFAPDDGNDSQSWQDRLEATSKRKAARAEEDNRRNAQLKPVEQRDREYRAQPKTLSDARYQSLKARGLTDEEIQLAIDNHWLWDFPGHKGFAIAALSLDGLIQGAQIANDSRDPKYVWHSKDQSARIPATGENPLFIWIHPDADRTKLRLILCEGALKPLVAALKFWRTGDIQRAFIGAAGGHFQVNSLTALIKGVGLRSIQLAPDAGAPENPTVMAIAANTFKICWNLGYKPTVKWWGQYNKPGRDVDELDGSESIRTLAGSQFLSLSNWRSLKKFTPHQTIEGAFCDFPAPQEGQMIAVRAGLGAGKTWRAIEILKNAELSAIVVTPTNTLGRNFVGRALAAGLTETYHFQSAMNVETDEESNASDSDASDSKPKAPKKNKSMFGLDGVKTFTLCPDSIVNLDPKALTNQIVIFDESMQNWVALLQRQTAIKGWRTRTRKVLKEILEVCHSVILLDGGLTDQCCEFWSELAPSKDLVKIQHVKTDFEPFDIKLIESPGDAEFLANVQTIALQNVAFRDEPFAILSDSKKDLEAFDRRFAAMGLKGYLLDSSTCSESWAKELIANPDKFIEENRPDYLLISPVASSGFDCSIRDYFKYAFLLSRGVLAIDDLMQHLARIRDPKVKRVVWCPPIGLSGGHPVVNESTIGECQAALVKYITDDATLGVGDLSGFSKRMEEIATQARQQGALIATSNIERKNLRTYLHEALILAGHTVKAGVVTEEDRSACKAQADTKATIKVEKAQVVHAAEELTTIEAEALKSKDSLNAEERAKMSRYRILNDLPGITNSQEWNATDQVAISKRVSCEARFKFVNDLLENNLISKARSWYLWQNPDAAAGISRERWAKILDGGEVKRLKSQELYLDALRTCGFEAVLSLDVITNDDPVLAHFLMNCRKKANRLKLSKTAKSLSDQNRTLALRNLIEQLGLVLTKAEEHDGRSDRIYKIESEIPASVMASIEAKIEAKPTQKTEETDEKKTGSADAGNPFTAKDRGATEGHTDPYKNRRPSVAVENDEFIPVENTIETEPDSPDWMSQESLEGIRRQWDESESDEEREAWRQIIPPHVLEAAIAA